MQKRNFAKLDEFKIIHLITLACIAFIIIPVTDGSIEIKFSGKETPFTYKTDESVSINWHLNYYPSKLESYTLSVTDKNNKKTIWRDAVQLNDASAGEHSPIDRSINLGKMAEGTYLAEFNSKPNDDYPAINYYDIFSVAPRTGSFQIASFYDANRNWKLDPGEGHEGPEFQITGPGGLSYRVKTGPNGISTNEVPIGLYNITEFPRDCWRPLSSTSQMITVLEDQTKQVAFNDKPDTDYTISAYDNSTHKGVSGFTFRVSSPEGTQELVSGPDGLAKPRSTGLPGTYTVTATPPANMELTTPKTIQFNPCIEKQVEFGANEVQPPKIIDLLPEDESKMGSKDVLFRWRTSEESTSELYIKEQGESNYTVLNGQSGLDHFITATNLTRNKWYDFYARSEARNRFDQSEPRSIFIDNGISFTKWLYRVTINRTYSQNCPISVKNTDNKPHELRVDVNSSASDIYFNFVGGGSADKVITLGPGETKDLNLVIHAQDAQEKNYVLYANLTNLGPENIVDRARIEVTVHWPATLFRFEEVGTDPVTLTKTLRVTNLGDPITDLSITPDGALLRNTVIQPSVRHMSLGQNKTVDIFVSPLWSTDIGAIKGTLTASAANVSETLNVDFSCKEGRQLYKVVLPGPQLHFDLQGGYCINQHPITDFFTLPPGLSAGDVLNAYIGMELNAIDPARQFTRYSTWVKINDNEVGRLSRTIPSGYYKFNIDPAFFSYSQAGLASNKYVLDSDMNRGYSTHLSNTRVVMCLKNLTLYVCAENEQQAKEIAWSSNWIYRPSKRVNVTILSPQESEQIELGKPLTIKVRVDGEQGGEKYCTVRGAINSQVIDLIDNGQHNDDLADDGIYAGVWIPDSSGISRINISAGNCVVVGHAYASVSVKAKETDIFDSAIWLTKTTEPQALDVMNMNTEEGNVVKYTITLGTRGDDIKDVKVIQTLPSYLRLNTNSLSKSGTVSLSNEGQNWSTTSITWDIGELTGPWNVTFDTTFNWRLPAGVNYIDGSAMPMSAVTYTNATKGAGRLEIPEGEIRFISGAQERTAERQAPVATETRPSPGVEPVFALLGILFVAFALRRR